MDNSIYEVERDDYVGFLRQLNKEKTDMEVHEYPGGHIIKLRSQKTGKHLTSRIIDDEKNEEHYFIFEMPDDDERIEPKGVMKITLDTKEEVQAFFDALNKLQMEAKKNAGDI